MSDRWYRDFRVCRITGTISTPARPGLTSRSGRGQRVERAHILPRKLCNNIQLNDENNVIMMRGDIHSLFDGALMTVSSSGLVQVDRYQPFNTIRELHGRVVEAYTRENDEYMKLHRAWVYSKGFEPWQE